MEAVKCRQLNQVHFQLIKVMLFTCVQSAFQTSVNLKSCPASDIQMFTILLKMLEFMQNANNYSFCLYKYREIIWEPVAYISPDPVETTHAAHVNHASHRPVSQQICHSPYVLVLHYLFNTTPINPWTGNAYEIMHCMPVNPNPKHLL